MCRPSHAQCIGAVDEFEVKAAMKKGFNATTKSNYLEPSQLRPAVRLALDFVGPLGGRVSDGEPGRGGGGGAEVGVWVSHSRRHTLQVTDTAHVPAWCAEMIDAHVTQHGQAAGKTGRKQVGAAHSGMCGPPGMPLPSHTRPSTPRHHPCVHPPAAHTQFESLVWPLVEGAGGPKQGLGRSHSSARASGACAPPPPPTGVAAERPVAVI
jgi:hypothetical protein